MMQAPVLCSAAAADALLRRSLAELSAAPAPPAVVPAGVWLARLVASGHDRLPRPGGGQTLQRWQALTAVAEHDLSLAKLYEGHTDALAILGELGIAHANDLPGSGSTWGTWASEAPDARVTFQALGNGVVTLRGTKRWCSGAGELTHGLLTAWPVDGPAEVGPQLVWVDMGQLGVAVDGAAWRAVGMSGSASVDVTFDGVRAHCVGSPGQYLTRPGFWQGGAGIAACWFGGAKALAQALRSSLANAQAPATVGAAGPHANRLAALGKVDLALQSTAAVLRAQARWIDDHPDADASAAAQRARLSAEACAQQVLEQVGRSLGATPFCRDARFARAAADLPVFIRQSHGERDCAELGRLALAAYAVQSEDPWTL